MKQKCTIILFFMFIFGILVLNVVLPDQTLSKSERRKLAAMPEITTETIFSGDFMKDLESYLLDQFPFRENFRKINSWSKFYGFRQLDIHDIYIQNQHAFKIQKELDEKQVQYAMNKFNKVYDKYLNGMNVYYSVIPEKNVYADTNVYPLTDMKKLKEIMNTNLTDFKEIEIDDLLKLDSYYTTDPHWKQEKIYPVAQKIIHEMHADEHMIEFEKYKENVLDGFYGAYYGQSALPLKPDSLTYMTSNAIEKTTVSSIEFEEKRTVYAPDLFEGMDGYDVYLSGAQAILEIELEDSQSDRELIIFRDSFGSSITPYFIGAYKKITMIDLRYISSDLLDEYVDFKNQDVLFLYSTSVLNNGMILK